MLQELDVLIGFVVVISVASLLVMVATQAMSSILALRGQNLRDALVALFSNISPDLNSNKGGQPSGNFLAPSALENASKSFSSSQAQATRSNHMPKRSSIS
jgi:hypothetical protein